jgi:N-acetylmuramoyl-L-alanine amidase
VKGRFSTTALSSLAGLALVGCAGKTYSPLSGSSHSGPSLIPAQVAEANPEIVVLPHEPLPVIGIDHFEADIVPPPTVTNAPAAPAVTPPTATFPRTWISLRDWTDRCGFGAAQKVGGTTTSYRITTRTGTCKLTIGTRLAQWNGVSVWLGFAPRMVQGEPYIHGLDAEKILMPLAQMPPASTLRTKTVVLDPGHGGTDSGTRGARHELEKTYTLDWALRTERLLTNAGWKVFLTRRADTDVSLSERVAFADRVQADLFISLHFNSTFPQTQPSGIETYCLTPVGAPSTLIRDYADNQQAIFPNNAFDIANAEWSYRIHGALLRATQSRDDGIKRARFMAVLRHQNRPAVLVEGGFLSNSRDTANITSAAYRESLAQAIFSALK